MFQDRLVVFSPKLSVDEDGTGIASQDLADIQDTALDHVPGRGSEAASDLTYPLYVCL
jgi:hypothetical protein